MDPLNSLIQASTDTDLIKTIRKQYAEDLILFASICITEDPHDSKVPWKTFPVNQIPYIQTLLNSFLVDNRIIVIKSRQVMVTWIYVIACFWKAMFHKGVRIAFVSKKGGSTRKLLERVKFVYDQLPVDWRPEANFVFHPEPKVEFPETKSAIYAYPQGADQLRSETFSDILSDEFAFQDKQEQTYTASKPTIDGGGKFIAVSTPNGQNNLFYKLSNDPSFKVFKIHYSMNPFKDEKWKKEAFSGLDPESIQQEYELNFLATRSNRIYNDFSPIQQVKPLVHNKFNPIFVGWDFGYNRPAVLFCQIYNGRLFILKSILGHKVLIDQFGQQVIQLSNQWFPDTSLFFDYCDIAGTQVNDKTERTSVQTINTILKPHNRYLRYRKFRDMEEGHGHVRRFMASTQNGVPCFLIDSSNQNLIEGFQGGYHYHGTSERICGCGINEFGKSEGDYFKHLQDCLRYVVQNIYGASGTIKSPKTSALLNKTITDKRFSKLGVMRSV